MKSKRIKTIFIGICALAALSTANAQTLNDGLIAHYPFNGNANDATGNGNDGMLRGDAEIVDGILNLDGNGDWVEFTDKVIPFNSDYSIALKVNAPDARNRHLQEIVAQAGQRSFFLGTWGNEGVRLGVGLGEAGNNRDTTGFQLADDGSLHDLVVVADNQAGTTALYYDGVLVRSYDVVKVMEDAVNCGFQIGRQVCAPVAGEFFAGQIDELRIYNRALSQAEVSELYELAKPEEVDWSQSTFQVVDGEFSWHEAKADAEARGGRLAILNTPEKNELGAELAQNTHPEGWDGNRGWIGLTDEENEGVWKWIDGTPLGWSDWYGSEPNSAHVDEDYATFWVGAKWADARTTPDHHRWLYILELPGAAQTTLSEGLVAYYPFNGNADDESGNDNNGTINGATLATDRNGNADSAYSFESSSIVVPDSTSLDLGGGTGFAMSAWINPRQLRGAGGAVNDWDAILSKHQTHPAYSLKVNNTGINAQFARSPGDGAPNYGWRGTVIELNAWSHLLVNYDNDKITCYLNGIAITTIDAFDDLDPQTTNTPLTIGTGSGNSDSNSFNGLIDDVRIYNRALSAEEVSELYDLEKPTLEQGLVAYYPFNGNADDESGNANNGTVNGATLTTDRNGNADSAYEFDGDDFIKVTDDEMLRSNTLTISSWVYSENGDNNANVIAKIEDIRPEDIFNPEDPISQWRMRLNAGQPVWDIITDTSWTTTTGNQIAEGKWLLVTVTWDGQTQRIYRNGQLDQENPDATDGNIVDIEGADLMFGRGWHPTSSFFTGKIDDIRIYNRALSGDEVSELYDLEEPPDPDPSPPVLTLEQFYEAFPNETITIDATPESGFPEDFEYQWYFGTFLIPELLGGKEGIRQIEANDDNNGLWKVIVSNSEGSTESIFYFVAFVDTDGDGISDGREELIIGSDPTLVDTDGDGINDYDEAYTYGTDPTKADTDGDGFDDLFEINANFDPLDQLNTPEAYLVIQTAVEIKFNAAKDVNYKIENSVDLENWPAIETGVLGKGGLVKRLYSIDNYPGRYFRVKRE